jgi:hypothetical protein
MLNSLLNAERCRKRVENPRTTDGLREHKIQNPGKSVRIIQWLGFHSAVQLATALWGAGRESNPDLQLRTLPCCSVTLPTHLELAPGIQPGSLR